MANASNLLPVLATKCRHASYPGMKGLPTMNARDPVFRDFNQSWEITRNSLARLVRARDSEDNLSTLTPARVAWLTPWRRFR